MNEQELRAQRFLELNEASNAIVMDLGVAANKLRRAQHDYEVAIDAAENAKRAFEANYATADENLLAALTKHAEATLAACDTAEALHSIALARQGKAVDAHSAVSAVTKAANKNMLLGHPIAPAVYENALTAIEAILADTPAADTATHATYNAVIAAINAYADVDDGM